jgi:chloramphenicol 3-O-phosphotransferase
LSQVVILNGVGKSSTARAPRDITAIPFLLVQMDMLPPAMIGHPNGVRSGPVVEQAMSWATGRRASRDGSMIGSTTAWHTT